uniref:Uncharacterized protein n=1 Tax=Plectus sambesii TaxID=2011161 RepID=A0A914X6J7_9BILA
MEQDSGKSIGNLVNSMPAKNRLLFKMMPASKKENLTKYYQKKSSMAIKACQTDDYLMQSLVGEAGMLRSLDDVNSLIAMCDFGQPTKIVFLSLKTHHPGDHRHRCGLIRIKLDD